MYELITNSTAKISADFTFSEFFYPDYPANFRKQAQPFYLNKSLIKAPQIIRSYFNLPVNITSCYRPHKSQAMHFWCMAIDLQINFNKKKEDMQFLINSLRLEFKTDLFFMLRKAGINGFGFRDDHLHLDIRQGMFNDHDEIGPCCLFSE